jgi:DnaK suppressor protein
MIGELAMNTKDLQRYQRLLLARLEELSAPGREAKTTAPGAGGQQGDLIDQANADIEADLEISRRQDNTRLLRDIEEALARIRRGTFGVCEVCKEPISKARLEAVPWTRVCRNCKEQEQSAA